MSEQLRLGKNTYIDISHVNAGTCRKYRRAWAVTRFLEKKVKPLGYEYLTSYSVTLCHMERDITFYLGTMWAEEWLAGKRDFDPNPYHPIEELLHLCATPADKPVSMEIEP